MAASGPSRPAAVREEDSGSMIVAPHDPRAERAYELARRLWRLGGGDPFLARHHRKLLREAGFTRIAASAST